MEHAGSFHSQLLAVVEVLAKAAVEEIHRRVDDSCAVLRLELSRSRRDIELLRRKWDMMEAEQRRSRMRVRRRVFYPPERHTPSVLHKDTQLSPAWSSQEDRDTSHTLAQREDTDAAAEDEVPQIKVECPGDDMWQNEEDHKLISGADFRASHSVHAVFMDSNHQVENPVNPVLPVQSYDTFPDQHLNQNQSKVVVKQEELDENGAPVDPDHRCKTEAEGEGRLWTSSPRGDITFGQYEHAPADASSSQTGLADAGPPQSTGSPRLKRRARPFGLRRSQADETHGTAAQSISINQSSTPQNPNLPRCRTPTDAPCSLTRMRIRTPWRSGGSGGGEKRFSCTYCGKRFMRFSQMTEHLRSHTGEKPFICQQCGKAFTKQFNLIRHAVVHSGEKPFGCSLCGKCFTQRSSLKSHLKTAH